jgi:predicted Fe-Mo cluster-binding NifX family protein
MNVVVSAQNSDIDSLVDPRFGRCRYLVVVDTETGEWVSYDNEANAGASGGAGVQAGNLLASLGARALVTGNVGPNAQRVLEAADVPVYQAGNGDTVREAVAALQAGQLTKIDGPTVSGHWS